MFKTIGVNQDCHGEILLKSINTICKPFTDDAGDDYHTANSKQRFCRRSVR